MSATGLFIVGMLVTLIVAGAMSLLVYAAILDGRDARARRTGDTEAAEAGGVVTMRSAGDRQRASSVMSDEPLADVVPLVER